MYKKQPAKNSGTNLAISILQSVFPLVEYRAPDRAMDTVMSSRKRSRKSFSTAQISDQSFKYKYFEKSNS